MANDIALQVQPIRLDNPVQQYANVLALQNQQRQGQTADLQYKNLLRAQDEETATSEAIAGAGGDYSKAANALLSRGLYKPANAMIASQAAADKGKIEMDKARADALKANLEVYANSLGGLAANPTPEALTAFQTAMSQQKIPLHAPMPSVMDGKALQQWIRSGAAMSQQGLRALEAFAPKVNMTDLGGVVQPTNTNPLAGAVGALPGAAPLEKTAAPQSPASQRPFVVGKNLVTADGKVLFSAAGGDGQSLPKPPKDYRWNKDGSEMLVIPGSATDQKMKAAKTKDEKNFVLLDSTLDAEIKNIDKLIGSEDKKTKEHKGLVDMLGPIMSRTPTLFADTADAEALADSLRSKASVSSLQTIRGTSGAIGTLTEKEWPRLESMKATLQQTQSPQQFRESLKEYRAELQRIKRLGKESISAQTYSNMSDDDIKKALGM